MRILGLDPGLAHTGYGLVEVRDGRLVEMGHGEIATPAGRPVAERLAMLEQDLIILIADCEPHAIAIEQVMGMRTTKSARDVLLAIGVILLTCENAGRPAREHNPSTWKKAVTGSGKAEKNEIQRAVQVQLDLTHLPRPDHAADALGIALYDYWQRTGRAA